MAGQDEISAAAAGFGHLRASHTDRDQVIGILKTAFVQGRLTKDEFDQRVSGTFASRTYADLAAITADLPVWLIRAEPPRQPATARDARPVEARAAQPVNKPLMWGAVAVVVAGVLAGVAAFPANSASMLAAGVFAILVGAPVAGTLMLDSWHANHPARPLPSRPARGIKAPSDRRGRIGDDLSLAAKPG